jgi:hypothetical protein
MESRIKALIRWNAVACVMRANEKAPGVGGHIASFQSAATLYEVGFNHFFHGLTPPGAATWSISRAIPPPASTPAPSWKAASARISSPTSARNPTATASPPIRTPG